MLKNVTLELSLKPFKDPSPTGIRAVIEKLLVQWASLYREADQLSFLLWIGDGSEILDYNANLDQKFEWAYWIGTANPSGKWPNDPEGLSPHSGGSPYTSNPPVFTYRWLRQLVAMLKEIGGQIAGKPIRVGATFDPGPEFAKSTFKYERHREILGQGWGGTFAYCYAKLNQDDRAYAGFPQGIPEGTTLGTFLGRQTRHFAGDLGFEYLWLSNGFGFGTETWAAKGALFNGKQFNLAEIKAIRIRLLGFWQDFRRECPDLGLETRGSNQSTGVDLGSDAVPLKEIYQGKFNFTVPPNSPWAAINSDFGMELAGWMSHIAELPDSHAGFPFRFYIHDPWWLNSPWLDRYERQPHDIIMPMSVSRLNAAGTVEVPNSVLLLTTDDSNGNMPDAVPDEVIPHIKAMLRTAPDQAGPLVWIYPFEEYNEWTFRANNPRPNEVFFGDRFIRNAINHGLPLNTVVSTTSLAAIAARTPAQFAQHVLVSPVPDQDTAWSKHMLQHLQQGGRALLYGSTRNADPILRELLGVTLAESIEGRFTMEPDSKIHCPSMDGTEPAKLFFHDAIVSGGGWDEAPAPNSPAMADQLVASKQGALRVCVAITKPNSAGGRIAWVRGADERDASLHDAEHRPETSIARFPVAALMRTSLGALGYEIEFHATQNKLQSPMLVVARHRNAFFFSGFMPSTFVCVDLKFPRGVPLLNNSDALFENGHVQHRLPRAWRHECRLFVEQADGIVTTHESHPAVPGVTWRIRVNGLRSARVAFYPDPQFEDKVQMLKTPIYPYMRGDFLAFRREMDSHGPVLIAENVTGDVMFSW